MEWYRKLYLGENIKDKRNKLISMIEKNAGTRRLHGIYVITLAANGKDLFDIFSADFLLQPVLHGHCPLIVGLSDDYDEAVDMVSAIILDMYQKNHNFDVTAYLRENLNDSEELAFHYPMEKLKPVFRLWKRKDKKTS